MFVLALFASCVTLGIAIQVSNGAFSPEAFDWAALSFGLAFVPAILPRAELLDKMAHRVLPAVMVVGLGYQFGVLASVVPGIYLRLDAERPLSQFQILLGIAAVTTGAALMGRSHRRLAPYLLVLYAVLGIWILKASPQPHIDVFSIHQQSLTALLRGADPYTLTFPNPYHSTQWFSPGTATRDTLLFGYVYPPWTLLAALPGFVFAQDYRYAFLTAVVASAALGMYARPGSVGARGVSVIGALSVFLFTPRAFFVLEQGWTEPSLLIGIAISVYAACRGRVQWLLPIGLGIVACAKQYSILAAPAVLLLLPMFPNWRAFAIMIAKALGIAAVVTLPLVVRHPGAFWYDVFGMQFSAPFRTDALSIPVYWLNKYGEAMPKSLQLGGPLALSILTLVRAPRNAAGFAWAGGTIYFAFFMFRHGFCNYYYLVIAIFALAMAVAGAPLARAALGAGKTSWVK